MQGLKNVRRRRDNDDRYAPRVETAPAPRVPTAAEIREAQRRADEAIKVIEKTTPEM